MPGRPPPFTTLVLHTWREHGKPRPWEKKDDTSPTAFSPRVTSPTHTAEPVSLVSVDLKSGRSTAPGSPRDMDLVPSEHLPRQTSSHQHPYRHRREKSIHEPYPLRTTYSCNRMVKSTSQEQYLKQALPRSRSTESELFKLTGDVKRQVVGAHEIVMTVPAAAASVHHSIRQSSSVDADLKFKQKHAGLSVATGGHDMFDDDNGEDFGTGVSLRQY
mmetsp:Transcript_3374/g.5916  ORF Transcript_3374/g.5916 Transcript_3374/m.5916 type:complete len:216 (-) Transcript_3374:553-1200(-)